MALLAVVLATRGYGHPSAASASHGGARHHPTPPPHPAVNPRLDPDWDGNGRPVTFAFGGDVHFPVGTNLGDRLAADPSDALGPTVPQLLSGVDLSMVNYESALTTDGTCPGAQSKQYVFYAPPSVINAFQGAGVSLITEANNHGEDCGMPGLEDALAARSQTGYTILGIGQSAAAGLHAVRDDHPRRAHRHHCRHPGHRLGPADGLDGHSHPAGPGLGLRRERPGGRRGGGALVG